MPTSPRFYRWLTQIFYWPLLVLVALWHGMPTDAPGTLPVYIALVLWVLPLLFPLYGLVKGKAYTHAWTNFILMFYFLHGLTVVYTHPDERIWSILEIIFTTGAFVGATGYARYQGRAEGLGLKKLKDYN